MSLNPVRLYATLAAGAAALSLVTGGLLWVGHMNSELRAARAVAATQTAKASVATGQSAAQIDAAGISDRGARRDTLAITLHEDHAHAIASARGADAPVDPAVNLAGARGLCDYAAYASDPGCAGLRRGDPAELPPAGGGGGAS